MANICEAKGEAVKAQGWRLFLPDDWKPLPIETQHQEPLDLLLDSADTNSSLSTERIIHVTLNTPKNDRIGSDLDLTIPDNTK
jgi:hypothetical protein